MLATIRSNKPANLTSKAIGKEFVITLVSVETDEEGIGFARTVAVRLDPGILPDWHYWLGWFCESEGEQYQIIDVVEIGTDYEF